MPKLLTSRLALLVGICLASLTAKPTSARAAEKFPAPGVDVLLKGWGGVPWGATLAEFKKVHPTAKQNKDGRWVTGKPDDLGGVAVTAEYDFNKAGRLKLVMFQPPDEARATLRQSLVAAGLLRDGPKPNWQRDGVSFILAVAGDDQIAVAISHQFADMPTTKPAPK